ncbi:MAG TPA: hypothetical protein DDW52_21640 [Planctomycetaceae bacterium]|nr:hypothetical protein [Planctomycetaceae bacterium]
MQLFRRRSLAFVFGLWLSSPFCQFGPSGLQPPSISIGRAGEPPTLSPQAALSQRDGTSDSKQAGEKEGRGPLKVGDKAVDFRLEGIDGTVQLSKVLDKKKNVILVFSRAYW